MLAKTPYYINDEDLFEGFQEAVINGQPRLAMEHLLYIVSDLQAQITELSMKSEATKAPAKTTAKAANKAEATPAQNADGE